MNEKLLRLNEMQVSYKLLHTNNEALIREIENIAYIITTQLRIKLNEFDIPLRYMPTICETDSCVLSPCLDVVDCFSAGEESYNEYISGHLMPEERWFTDLDGYIEDYVKKEVYQIKSIHPEIFSPERTALINQINELEDKAQLLRMKLYEIDRD